MSSEMLNGAVVLVNTNARNHLDSYRLLSKLNLNGVCLLLNRPAENMRQMLKGTAIDMPISFIDGISAQVMLDRNPSHLYIKNPGNLGEIADSIEIALAKTPASKVLIIDSINDLSVYHHEKEILALLGFIADRTRKLGITTFILHQQEFLSKHFMYNAGKMCDAVITLP